MTPAAQVAGGRRETRWTRENIIEKIKEWVALYGEPPRAADWNPSSAKWSGQTWRIERYLAGDWPSLNAAKKPFDGSLTAAIVAAGFEPAKPGPVKRRDAAPETNGRVQMSPVARSQMGALTAEVRELAERVAVRDRQLARAREDNSRLRDEVGTARRDAASARREVRYVEAPTKTITKTNTVRVADSRAARKAERLEAKLEAAEAEARSERDARKLALRDLSKARAREDALKAALEDAESTLREAESDRKSSEDRLVAAERAAARPRVEIREVEVRSATDQEVADARAAARAAEVAADEAEVRAARAERQMRELSALVTGEDRRLTAAEVADLRKGGPSGPGVLASAFKELAQERSKRGPGMAAALTKVASAAIRWRESL